MHFTESCPSGRRSTIGNRVGVKSVSGVQIPDSPPAPSHGLLPPNGPCSIPCGGVAEWLNAAVSKTVYPVSPGTRVRIPPPPPVYFLNEPPMARFSLWIARTQYSKAPAAARLIAAMVCCGNRSPQQSAAQGGRKLRTSPQRLSCRHIAGTQQPQRAPREHGVLGLMPHRRQRFPPTPSPRQPSSGAAKWKPAGSEASGQACPTSRRARCNPTSHTAAAA